ncbi:MAG: DUF4214 domain-containing protein, partial [Rhizobiaceae bacterium]|nr:DUF4214 domain-containing protein [Rhizobiaceae bacterium]
MAKFVANSGFDARAASASFYSIFVEHFTGYTQGTDGVGFDGQTYADYFIVNATTDDGTFQLALGGEFEPGSVTPTGTLEYLSVAQGSTSLFYASELQLDVESILPLLLTQPEPGEIHPLLLGALAGDDQITLSGDADYFDASTGVDQVVYDGARADFSVTEGAEGQLTVTADADATDIDTLVNVEKLTFTDGTLLFDLDSENASFAYRIYAAAYGRTPDEAGLRFWTGVLDERGDGPPEVADKEFVASFFLTANEFTDVYGENPTNEEYINKLYQNVLHREADQDGYDFWLGKIEEGEGRDDMLIYFTDSGENLQ